MADWHTVEHHNAVANQLVQEPTISFDDSAHLTQVIVQPRQDLLRRLFGGLAGEIANVRKQDSHSLFLTRQNELCAPPPDLFRQFRGNVTREKAH